MNKCNFKDVNQYKKFIGYDSMSEIEKDIALLDFECINKSFEHPNEFLDFKSRELLKIAQKYNLDFIECFKKALSGSCNS